MSFFKRRRDQTLEIEEEKRVEHGMKGSAWRVLMPQLLHSPQMQVDIVSQFGYFLQLNHFLGHHAIFPCQGLSNASEAFLQFNFILSFLDRLLKRKMISYLSFFFFYLLLDYSFELIEGITFVKTHISCFKLL